MAVRYVVDGNFTAQHMKMRRPECDIALADGLGYMVEDGPYQNHVSSAHETKEVRILDTWTTPFHLDGSNRNHLVKTTVL